MSTLYTLVVQKSTEAQLYRAKMGKLEYTLKYTTFSLGQTQMLKRNHEEAVNKLSVTPTKPLNQRSEVRHDIWELPIS